MPESFQSVFDADALVGGGGASQAVPCCAQPSSSAQHPPIRVFVDVGSGYGTVVRAAVEEGGFARGIGIEKYR